jgi:hypothetical protein
MGNADIQIGWCRPECAIAGDLAMISGQGKTSEEYNAAGLSASGSRSEAEPWDALAQYQQHR